MDGWGIKPLLFTMTIKSKNHTRILRFIEFDSTKQQTSQVKPLRFCIYIGDIRCAPVQAYPISLIEFQIR